MYIFYAIYILYITNLNKTDVTRCEQATLTILSQNVVLIQWRVWCPLVKTLVTTTNAAPPILPIHANILPDIRVTIVVINYFAKAGPIL